MTIPNLWRRGVLQSAIIGMLVASTVAPFARAQGTAASGADQSGVVTGRIRASETGQPVPFARVSLDDSSSNILAKRDGSFRIVGVAAGRHTLLVRQIGFLPEHLAVVVDASRDGLTPNVTVTLHHVPMNLDAVHVIAAATCSVGGFGDTATASAVQTLFGQVSANVAQNREVARRYLATTTYLRRRWSVTEMGAEVAETIDSVIHRPNDGSGQPYVVGGVITTKVDSTGHTSFSIVLPGVGSFASDNFLSHHCFHYAGVDSQSAHPMYRIDFVPTSDVKGPDVDGSVYLDTQSFLLRRTRFHVVNVPKDAPFRDLEATATFREIAPFFVVNDSLESTRNVPGLRVPGGGSVVDSRQLSVLVSCSFAVRDSTDVAPPCGGG